MKYWLSHLPLEVWVDVFCYPWISREELGRIVDRFSNRRYAEYLQFYLHDWGKHKLKNLWLDQNGFYKLMNYEPCRLYMNIPQTQMPENIKSFQRISIRHFDAQTIAFLRQTGPILTDVNLGLYGILPSDMENLRFVLTHLLPLLNGIHSLHCDVRELPTMEQCFGKEKLNKIKVLKINGRGFGAMDEAAVQAMANILPNWLISPGQDDNGPRYCKAFLCSALFEKISPAIRQEFLAAKSTCTFALTIFPFDSQTWRQFVDFHLQNNNGEELHGVKKFGIIRITRHRANCGKVLQEWIGANKAQSHRGRIEVIDPTVGLIDTTMDVPENFDIDHRPSTSKKARMI